MKKFTSLLIFAILFSLTASATRPLRRTVKRLQSDGTSVSVQKEGNAFLNYYVTQDGVVLVSDGTKRLCYADFRNGDLVSTGTLAHEAALRTADEQALVAELKSVREEARTRARELHVQSVSSTNGLAEYGTTGSGTIGSIGAHTYPVIMTGFSNRAFQDTTTLAKVQRIFNEEGYSDEQYAIGSVRDYFIAQSDSLYLPSYDVVDSVGVSGEYATYGKSAGSATGARKLLKEALDSAAAHGVDFSQYVDEKGSIPLVCIYFAGPGAHSAYEDESDNYIWGHFQKETSTAVSGIKVRSVLVINETLQHYNYDDEGNLIITDTIVDGIGVGVHELGHALGLWDYYYTGSNSTIADTLLSMDYWSVMDYGQYYYDGYRPIGYMAFDRAQLGWQKVEELTDSTYHELYSFADAYGQDDRTSCYKITNPDSAAQYFLLENRQVGKWYPTVQGTGMLISWVNYSASRWNNNTINNVPNEQHFTYVPADQAKEGVNSQPKSASWKECKADLFPGTTNVTEFKDYTSWLSPIVGSDVFETELYDIQENDGVIKFCYANEALTGIGQVTRDKGQVTSSIYDLQGRKLSKVQKGLNIVNGQKYIVK